MIESVIGKSVIGKSVIGTFLLSEGTPLLPVGTPIGASLLSGGPLSSAYLGYLLAFVVATAACLGAAWRARSAVPDPETRRALTWFFLGSAGWAGAYVGFLLAGSALGKHLFYQVSLIVGFGTVFAWLWFCSAYSGRGLHRSLKVQQFAAAVFVIVTALKVTNPLHGLYYGLEPMGGAFGLVVTHETLYWVVMAVAYALAAAGYLMIFEFLLEAEAKVLPLGVLTGLTSLPAALNVVGHVEPALLDITHEPLGVAVFAVGLMLVYETQFSVVQLTGSVGEPHLTIGKEGRIKGFGGGIGEIIPSLEREVLGAPLEQVLPGLAKTIEEREAVWRASFDGGKVEECQDSEPTSRRQPASGPQHAGSTQSKEGSRMAEEAGRAGGDTQPREDAQPREDVQPVGHLSSEEVSSVDEVSGVEHAAGVEDASGMEDASYLNAGARSEEDCRCFQVVEVGARAHGETRTVVLSDITERKRRTERLKEAKKQAELSKLEAQEASRMKSAMLANMSHEIRTPLTGIIGFAEAIGEETEGNETGGNETGEGDTGGEDAEKEGRVAHFAGLIEDSGRRLLDTLDAVLNLSKLEAGKMSLQPGPVDLAGQARQVAREFEEEAAESGLALEVQTEEAWARADEGGLKIVLQNLLSNAIKYTEEGGVTVRVYREENSREESTRETSSQETSSQSAGQKAAEEAEAPTDSAAAAAAVLEVEDSGIGMDPEVAGRLFEPFRQASEGMSREYEGTGIGLAVTKRAAEEMGGSIEVDTQKGEGSRFTVRFPAARSAGSAGGPPAGEPQQANQRDLDKPASPR